MCFFLKNKINDDISDREKKEFEIILLNLRDLLLTSKNEGQAEFIDKLLFFLKEEVTSKFIELINSVDMWGGSGSVVDVYIEDKNNYNEFMMTIIKLTDLMENTRVIMYNSIKGTRRLFNKILREHK